MRKTYEKPEILFESFASSTNIAANCKTIIDTQARNQCGYLVEGADNTLISVFTGDLPAVCKYNEAMDGSGDDAYNGICYHVPTEATALFNS